MGLIEAVEAVMLDLQTVRPCVLSVTTKHRRTTGLVRLRNLSNMFGFGDDRIVGGDFAFASREARLNGKVR